MPPSPPLRPSRETDEGRQRKTEKTARGTVEREREDARMKGDRERGERPRETRREKKDRRYKSAVLFQVRRRKKQDMRTKGKRGDKQEQEKMR